MMFHLLMGGALIMAAISIAGIIRDVQDIVGGPDPAQMIETQHEGVAITGTPKFIDRVRTAMDLALSSPHADTIRAITTISQGPLRVSCGALARVNPRTGAVRLYGAQRSGVKTLAATLVHEGAHVIDTRPNSPFKDEVEVYAVIRENEFRRWAGMRKTYWVA